MLITLIVLGALGFVGNVIVTYRLVWGKGGAGKRLFVPALFVGLLSAVLPFLISLRKDLYNALIALPARDFIALQWRAITLLAGTVLEKILIVIICIGIGVFSYFLIGSIVWLFGKLVSALKGGQS